MPEKHILRSEDEIIKAHDLFVSILMGEVSSAMLDGDKMELIAKTVANVLCWALHHDNNKAFTSLLEILEEEMKINGYVLIQRENNPVVH